MTTFYLIRHAENDLVGKAIAGRAPGIHLNAEGRRQAEHLAAHLASSPIQRVFTSPLERARETAEPLADRLKVPLEISQSFIEIDFVDWTAKPIAELDRLEEWRKWNTLRSVARAPNGESMLEVQERFVGELERVRRRFPEQAVAVVSHGDPLRSVLVYYLGMHLDMLLRLEISTASVSIVSVDDWTVRVMAMNLTAPPA